jgi:TPP-dependent pyruvate/acetoin dehydrogenase alpha subunit
MDGVQVDGNDVLAVYVATSEAVEKARKGGGPTLIEAITYRLAMHTTADDPKKYRDDAEVKKWEKRDPVPRFTNYLMAKGILDDKTLEAVEADVKEQIKAGVEEYEANRSVDPLDSFKYIYNDLPAELIAQRQEFEAALQREGIGQGH